MKEDDEGLASVRSVTLFLFATPLIGLLFFAWKAGNFDSAPLRVGLFLTGLGCFSALLSYRFFAAGRVLLKGFYFFLFLAFLLCFGLSLRDVLGQTPEELPAMLTIFGFLLVVSWYGRKILVTKLDHSDSTSLKL